MTSAVLWGLTAGLATLAVSEIVLRRSGPLLRRALWKTLLAGAAARTVWVLFALALVLARAPVEPRAFTISLLLGYLAAQVIEGMRYQRFFERQ